jgi:hypothetical protein
MLKTVAFAITIAAVAAVSAPVQAMLSANGTSLTGVAPGVMLNGQTVGIELPAGPREAEAE